MDHYRLIAIATPSRNAENAIPQAAKGRVEQLQKAALGDIKNHISTPVADAAKRLAFRTPQVPAKKGIFLDVEKALGGPVCAPAAATATGEPTPPEEPFEGKPLLAGDEPCFLLDVDGFEKWLDNLEKPDLRNFDYPPPPPPPVDEWGLEIPESLCDRESYYEEEPMPSPIIYEELFDESDNEDEQPKGNGAAGGPAHHQSVNISGLTLGMTLMGLGDAAEVPALDQPSFDISDWSFNSTLDDVGGLPRKFF